MRIDPTRTVSRLLILTLAATAPADTAPDGSGDRWPGAASAAAGNGACCLVEGCIDTVDAAECSASGGFFLPGETCATDPCAVGACCAGGSCIETTAFNCLSGGRTFIGAGTRCEDNPCEIDTGACCLAGACSIVTESDCTGGGGVWLGLGSNCAGSPCALGACCVPGACTDGARYECDDPGGTFLEGETCASDPCSSILDCAPGSFVAQLPDGPASFLGLTSEQSAGFLRFENFAGVPGPIDTVTWWGFDLDHVGGGTFEECVETDNTFVISFHRDAAGTPGEQVCVDKVDATRTPLGIEYGGAELNEYTATLSTPCPRTSGWVSIVGLGDLECWFLWISAGNGESYCAGCAVPHESLDLSLCLGGTVGGVVGACCDDASGTCLDGVDIADCATVGLRFEPETTCDELDRACGDLLGACCFDGLACDVLTDGDCAAAGGGWLGPDTRCEDCPCLTPCPPGGTLEGEPRCEDGYEDAFNGGCNGSKVAFSPIALGETVCGESGLFFAAGKGTIPDVDVYEVTTTETLILTWTVVAEFQPRLSILDGSKGCPGGTIVTTAGTPCSEVGLAAQLPAGTYWLLVRPNAFTDEAVCGARYTATLGPDPCPEDLDVSGIVDFADLLAVLAAWGPCPDCPEDLDGSGVVDFADLLAVLAAWGACPA